MGGFLRDSVDFLIYLLLHLLQKTYLLSETILTISCYLFELTTSFREEDDILIQQIPLLVLITHFDNTNQNPTC